MKLSAKVWYSVAALATGSSLILIYNLLFFASTSWELGEVLGERIASQPTALMVETYQYRTGSGMTLKDALDFENPGEVSYQVVTSERRETLVHTSFVFDSFDSIKVPGIVLEPIGSKRLRGLVLIPGHVRYPDSGLSQLTNDVDSYQNRAAYQLAKEGYPVAVLELRGFGILGPPNFINHETVAFNAHLADTSYQSIAVKDIAALRVVMSKLTGIPTHKIGVAGASLGGELALKFAAINDDVPFAISHSFGGEAHGFLQSSPKKPRHYCHLLSNDNLKYPTLEVLRHISPRPILLVRGLDNPFSDPKFMANAKEIWDIAGHPSMRTIQINPGGHEFFVNSTLDFLEQIVANAR